MHPKLFSTSHMSAAKTLFPERISLEWCNTQWTDEEINCCKSYELKEFSKSPRLSNYPGIKFLEDVPKRDEFEIIDSYIKNHPEIKCILSVGCGLGQFEIFLARRYPGIDFLCIDNAPYIESLNPVIKELQLSNIAFKNFDLRNGPVGEFDLVFSMSVIYCIPNDSLSDYFSALNKSKKTGGVIIVGCTSV